MVSNPYDLNRVTKKGRCGFIKTIDSINFRICEFDVFGAQFLIFEFSFTKKIAQF